MKLKTDIYFTKEYCDLCALAEEGEVTQYEFKSDAGYITYLFLKRPIYVEGIATGYYDIVSPYGYGGPVIRNTTNKDKLLCEYIKDFTNYCSENNIVSEFVRFHPIIENALDFKDALEVIYSRHTVGTNIAGFDDPITSECSKSCRKKIRQALNKGVTYRVIVAPDSLDRFKDIYYATMDRNSATDYYYFDDKYFDTCLSDFKDNIITVEAYLDDELIAMNLCFISGDYLHIHLSGTKDEYLYLSPAYILRYALIEWAKDNGIKYIHHGGGRSGAEDDSLYLFKKQFGVNTAFDFYIGKKIHNNEKYLELCKILNKPVNTDYFPAYRA